MRTASSWAAKPPNTTEWIAPSRAQASIADDRLGHHRQVEHDAIAALHAEAAQRAREAGDLVAQLAVAVVRWVPVTGLS